MTDRTSSTIQILQEFKRSVVTFFDELIEQCPEEPQFVIFRILIKDQLPTTEVMNYFIREIYPQRGMIKKQDEKFILETNCLFSSLDKSNVNYLRKLWRSPTFDAENRTTMWRWLSSFIYFIEKYQKAVEAERIIVKKSF